MMKYILILSFSSINISAQTVEIKGKAIITDVEAATESAEVLARETDGTLSVFSNSTAMPPSIGDFAHGGVVFWMSADGKHGKVVAVNNAGYRSWYNVTSAIASSTFTDAYGPGRTLEIVRQGGHADSAAKRALDFFYTGFDDWYLPTQAEGVHITNNWATLNTTIAVHNGASLAEFWTSTEISSTNAFSSGLSTPKNFSIDVRPVRSFWVED